MYKFYKFLFFNTMIAGTLITVSAFSWFSMWLGLEINLLSIIPLLNSEKNTFPSESALKYFITQSMASTIILFAILFILNNFEIYQFSCSLVMNSAILTKMGAAPFHFWFPEIVEGLNWINNFIILTWQKIAPMILIFYFIDLNYFFLSVILTSAMIGSIMGLNQNSLRKIMAFSSINHISWLLASMFFSMSIWLIYFFVYSIILFSLTYFFHKMHMFHLFQLMNFSNSNKITNLSIFLSLFSLGGLPPFLGFLPKWFVIYNLTQINQNMISFMMIIFTLITLFYYLRLTFFAIINSYEEFIFPKSHIFQSFFWISNSINFTGLAWCSWLYLNF